MAVRWNKGAFVMTNSIPILLLVVALGAYGQQAEDQEARIRALQHRFLAPCCYTETVYDHRSEIALQMQGEIRRMVAEGRSDRDILDFYKDQYGMRVLVEPEGDLWWVMNVVPVLALIAGLLAAVYVLRRWRRPLAPDALQEQLE
jgi:cytochrome c-type biogenesis protein CcmH